MIRLYNVLRKFRYLSTVKKTKVLETPEPEKVVEELEVVEVTEENAGLTKALETYRKLIEKKGGKDADPLTEKEQESLEKRISQQRNHKTGWWIFRTPFVSSSFFIDTKYISRFYIL